MVNFICTECDICTAAPEGFDDPGVATPICSQCGVEMFLDDDDDYEDDGQPTEYEEWQDFYGGDDWDHGQFDDCGEW